MENVSIQKYLIIQNNPSLRPSIFLYCLSVIEVGLARILSQHALVTLSRMPVHHRAHALS